MSRRGNRGILTKSQYCDNHTELTIEGLFTNECLSVSSSAKPRRGKLFLVFSCFLSRAAFWIPKRTVALWAGQFPHAEWTNRHLYYGTTSVLPHEVLLKPVYGNGFQREIVLSVGSNWVVSYDSVEWSYSSSLNVSKETKRKQKRKEK